MTNFKPSSFFIALCMGGMFIAFIYGFIGSIQGYYSIDVEDRYVDVYNKIGNVSSQYGNPMREELESEKSTKTEDVGYFWGLDRVWEAIKTPFKLIDLTSDLLQALIIDLELPDWVNWGNFIGGILMVALVFLILSAMMKYRM